MKKYFFSFLILSLVISNYSLVIAEGETWEELMESALAYYQLGKYKEAIGLLEKSIDIAQRDYGKEGIKYVAASENFIAACYQQVQEYDKAEKYYKRSLDKFIERFGDGHPFTGQATINISSVYFDLKKYQKAVENYKIAAEIFNQNYGDTSNDYAKCCIGLAKSYKKLNMFVEAEENFTKALVIYSKNYSKKDSIYIVALYDFAEFYKDMNIDSLAEVKYLELLNIYRELYSPDKPENLQILERLSYLYFKGNRVNDLDEIFRKRKLILGNSFNEEHPKFIQYFKDYGDYQAKLGKLDSAKLFYNKALQILEQQVGRKHIGVADLLSKLSSLYEEEGDFFQALGFNKQATKIYADLTENQIINPEDKIDNYKKKETEILKNGKDYALMFATDDYDNSENLKNPVYDARTIGKELSENYLFEVDIVENATQEEILSKLRKYSILNYEPNDQLFIYFAGHGHFDNVFREGYVVAKDSYISQSNMSLISFNRLRAIIDNIPCKHIFLVMDVCFGGTFDPKVIQLSRVPAENMEIKEYITNKMKYKTRKYLTSGGKETVPDGVPGSHSPFSRKILDALRNYGNQDKIITITEFVSYVEVLKPQPFFNEFGDNEPGSDFIFVAK